MALRFNDLAELPESDKEKLDEIEKEIDRIIKNEYGGLDNINIIEIDNLLFGVKVVSTPNESSRQHLVKRYEEAGWKVLKLEFSKNYSDDRITRLRVKIKLIEPEAWQKIQEQKIEESEMKQKKQGFLKKLFRLKK